MVLTFQSLKIGLNIHCIPENFNTNISHQLFGYKLILVNFQLEITNSKVDYVLKTGFKDFWYTNINLTPI